MQTLLDSRSRPSTEAQRAKAFAKPDPTTHETFTMASQTLECIGCGTPIEPGHPAWIRKMPEDSSEVQFAKLDEDYDGEDVFAYHCWSCAQKHLGDAVRDYGEERRQCAREERLEIAIAAEAAGQLQVDHWFEIAEANMGFCAPDEVKAKIDELVQDYEIRFRANANGLEQCRAKLWGFVPMGHRAKGPVASLVTEGEPKVSITHLDDPGLARVDMQFLARLVIR